MNYKIIQATPTMAPNLYYALYTKDFYIFCRIEQDYGTVLIYGNSDENEKYRIVGVRSISRFDYDNINYWCSRNNVLPELRYDYRHHSTTSWNIQEIFKTDDEKELHDKMEELEMEIFTPFEQQGEEVSIKIDNQSVLSKSQVVDCLCNFDFIKVLKYDIVEDMYHKFYVNDSKPKGYLKNNETLVASPEFYTWLNKHFDTLHYSSGCEIPTFYSDKESEIYYVTMPSEYAININKLKITMSKPTTENTMTVTVKSLFYLTYEIGKPLECFKKMKKTNKAVSPLEMFNINTQTIRRPNGLFIYSDASNFFNFFTLHSKFFEKSGFRKLVKDFKSGLDILPMFLLYLSLIYDYPVIELLIKMGHTNLIEDIFKKLLQSSRKDVIKDNVKELENLIDTEKTKGAMVLRFPSYVGDYLKEKNAKLREYLFWRDVSEISSLSKEQFERFNESDEKILISASLSETQEASWMPLNDWYSLGLQEIIKYPGYSLEKTVKYCWKKFIEQYDDRESYNNYYHHYNNDMKHTFVMLKDTLLMAEEMGFELENYPDNLKQIHDQLAEVRQTKIDALSAKVVGKIGDECDTYLKKVFASGSADLPTNAMKKYTYVIPRTQLEFTQEGQNQHNCVAGYYNRVKKGDCIIFFVRQIANPEQSYITAEITKNGIAQVMYSNNRPVERDSDAYKYCRYIANKIIKAVERDDILALNKVTKRLA